MKKKKKKKKTESESDTTPPPSSGRLVGCLAQSPPQGFPSVRGWAGGSETLPACVPQGHRL